MKRLIESVKDCSLQSLRASCNRSFLDSTTTDPACQRIARDMMAITPEQVGTTGGSDPYHFEKDLNRITITGENSEDYRLVLFFIKKGTKMPLHDHPNMSVYFRVLFGQLKYNGYDKVVDKFKYNDFSNDEHEELLGTKKAIKAKKSRDMILRDDALLYVRPSANNMHTFEAQENTCFFDICLPNYSTSNCLRKITYFKENPTFQPDAALPFDDADVANNRASYTEIVYDTTPPVMPTGFAVNDLAYRGEMR